MRTLIADLFGRAAGPVDHCGFGLADAAAEGLKPVVGDFVIGAGRYYVDGLLVENERALYYSAQPELLSPEKLNAGSTYLAYLDVWERHITYLEDYDIREVALGGPDTCTRVRTTWQVKLIESTPAQAAPPEDRAKLEAQLRDAQAKLDEMKKALEQETDRTKQASLKKTVSKLEKQFADFQAKLTAGDARPAPAPAAEPGECGDLLKPLLDWVSGTMAARVEPAQPSDTPCVLAPESRYRGLENHLYRVEIHTSGDTADADHIPTFKWSRENSSILTRWIGTTASDVRVANSGTLPPVSGLSSPPRPTICSVSLARSHASRASTAIC